MSELRRPSQVMTLIVTCLGTFLILLDASIVSLALPAIQTGLHASLSGLQWTIDAYTLPIAVLLLTAGTLGDRFGRKRFFLFGLVLFLLGSTFCGFAPTLSWLLFGRVVQGVGGAALSTSSLSVLAAAYPDPRTRAQAIGIWSGVSGLALAVGPLVGGVLIAVASWPAIFLVNLPIGLVTLVLAWRSLAESRNPDARQIDLPGQLLVIAGLTCLVIGLIESSSAGWTSAEILGLFLGAVVLLSVFLSVEFRSREPLLPLPLFRNRVFSIANIVAFVTGFSALSTIFFLAQYLQQVQGYTVLEAAVLILPFPVGTFLMAPLAGRITGRLGPRLPLILGALLTGGGLLLLMSLEPGTSYGQFWWILALLGIGYAFLLSPSAVAVLSATPPQRAGLGSSMLNANRQIGVTLGIAVLGAIVVQHFSENIASQLTQRGVPGPLGATIARKIGSLGAQASHLPLSGKTLLSPFALHQAITQAFVDALHGSFLIAGVAVLATALLVAFADLQPETQAREKPTEATTPPEEVFLP